MPRLDRLPRPPRRRLLAGGAVSATPAPRAAVPDEDLAYRAAPDRGRVARGRLPDAGARERAARRARREASQGRPAQEKAHLAGLSSRSSPARARCPRPPTTSTSPIRRTRSRRPPSCRGLADSDRGALARRVPRRRRERPDAAVAPARSARSPRARRSTSPRSPTPAGKPVLGRAFAPSLQIDAVSAALDAYES